MEFVPRVLSAACPEARAEVASAAKRAAGDTNLLRLAQVKKEPLRELCFSQCLPARVTVAGMRRRAWEGQYLFQS